MLCLIYKILQITSSPRGACVTIYWFISKAYNKHIQQNIIFLRIPIYIQSILFYTIHPLFNKISNINISNWKKNKNRLTLYSINILLSSHKKKKKRRPSMGYFLIKFETIPTVLSKMIKNYGRFRYFLYKFDPILN